MGEINMGDTLDAKVDEDLFGDGEYAYLHYVFEPDIFGPDNQYMELIKGFGDYSDIVSKNYLKKSSINFRDLVTRHDFPSGEFYMIASNDQLQVVGATHAVQYVHAVITEEYGESFNCSNHPPDES